MSPEERAEQVEIVTGDDYYQTVNYEATTKNIAEAIRAAEAEKDEVIANLRATLNCLADRVAAQSELLAKRAERD